MATAQGSTSSAALKLPTTRSRFFKASDIHDLFSLSPEDDDTVNVPRIYGSKVVLKADEKKSAEEMPSKKRLFSQEFSTSHAANEGMNEGGPPQDDLLRTLFSVSGVQTHIHDEAVNSFSTPDVNFLNQEAEKIVSRSMRLLEDSNPYQKYILSKSVPLLTMAEEPSILGSSFQTTSTESSRSLLSSLLAKSTPLTALSTSISSDPLSLKDVSPLTLELIQFFKEKGGSAKTDHILSHFQAIISPDEAILFKKLLKAVATLTPLAKNEKIWILKSSL